MKKSVKNLKINKKIVGGFILATGILGLIISMKKETKVVLNETSLEQTLNENKEKTNLDEILDLKENISDKIQEISPDIKTIVPMDAKTSEEEYLLDCVKKIELYIDLSSKISKLSFDGKNNLKDVDDSTRLELFENRDNENFVNDLIKTFSDDKSTDIEKARCMQKLNYLDSYYKKYVTENGFAITGDLVIKLLQSYGCSVSGLEPKNYDSCTVKNVPCKISYDVVMIVDPVSGALYEYCVSFKSGIIDDLMKTLSDIEKVINNGDYNYNDVYDICVSALNNVKNLLKIGVKLDKDILGTDVLVLDEVNYNENNNVKIKSRMRA